MEKTKLLAVFTLLWVISSILYVLAVKYQIPLAGEFLKYLAPDSSPLNIIGGCAVFFLFKKIKIQHNKWINILAMNTFGVLLIHDSNFFRYVIWHDVIQTHTWIGYSLLKQGVCIFITVILIFLICSVIEYCRRRFIEEKMLSCKWYKRLCFKVEKYFYLNNYER